MNHMDDKALASMLRILSTERRVAILRTLLDSPDPLPSSTIAAVLGSTEAAASYNLRELAQAGLVRSQQSGRWVFYGPDREVIEKVFAIFGKGSDSETQ